MDLTDSLATYIPVRVHEVDQCDVAESCTSEAVNTQPDSRNWPWHTLFWLDACKEMSKFNQVTFVIEIPNMKYPAGAIKMLGKASQSRISGSYRPPLRLASHFML